MKTCIGISSEVSFGDHVINRGINHLSVCDYYVVGYMGATVRDSGVVYAVVYAVGSYTWYKRSWGHYRA